MTRAEAAAFMETMEKHGDYWSEDEVIGTYRSKSLDEALRERMESLENFTSSLEDELRTEKNQKEDRDSLQEAEKFFNAYSRLLLRSLNRINGYLVDARYEDAKELLSELIEDTTSDIHSMPSGTAGA